MISSTHQSTLHLSFKIKCCVDRLRPPAKRRPEQQSRSQLSTSRAGRLPHEAAIRIMSDLREPDTLPGISRDLSGSAHDVIAKLAGIAEIGGLPAIQIVLGHALLGESLEFIGIAGSLCAEQAVAADFLSRTAVVDFVKLVPAAELARQTVPQQFEQLDAFFGLISVRAAQILIEIGSNFGIL